MDNKKTTRKNMRSRGFRKSLRRKRQAVVRHLKKRRTREGKEGRRREGKKLLPNSKKARRDI